MSTNGIVKFAPFVAGFHRGSTARFLSSLAHIDWYGMIMLKSGRGREPQKRTNGAVRCDSQLGMKLENGIMRGNVRTLALAAEAEPPD